jgi:hypothetical protein
MARDEEIIDATQEALVPKRTCERWMATATWSNTASWSLA